jgi:hypothetical protein
LRQGDHAARLHQGHHAAAGQDASTSTVIKKASQDSSQAGRRRLEAQRVGGHPPNIILHRHDLSRNCIWLANHARPIGSRQQGAIYQRPGAGRLPSTEGGSSRLRRRTEKTTAINREAPDFQAAAVRCHLRRGRLHLDTPRRPTVTVRQALHAYMMPHARPPRDAGRLCLSRERRHR